MSVAFGVQNQGSVGTTAAELRQIMRYKWGSAGVVGGLAVTGGRGLSYSVAAGMAVCTKGASDGFTEAYWPGGATGDVSANTSSSDRIDAVWITAHDATQGDADNLVAVGVTQGTPGQGAPDVPGYATPIAYMLVPGGATSTSAASMSAAGAQAVPYGASLGILVNEVDTTNTSTAIPSGYRTYAAGTFTLPTARYVDIKRIFTLGGIGGDGSVYARVLVDGAQTIQNEVRAYGSPTIASSQYIENTVLLEAGQHTIQAQMTKGVGQVRKYWQRGTWAGQTLQLVDAGIAQVV